MREKLIKLLERSYFFSDASLADCLIANDVVPVLRCKKCKYWSDGIKECTDRVKFCTIGYYMVGENGYCVFGERKDNG